MTGAKMNYTRLQRLQATSEGPLPMVQMLFQCFNARKQSNRVWGVCEKDAECK